ncbi:hypothetical protein [Eubacterium ramulus]|uniref:hypothetical protein n=1 Tax=Eubacterium ramulus TaxID=39490 RepID=UPI0022E525A1|nr:hypothetical protein [Eubacterium ramulus]
MTLKNAYTGTVLQIYDNRYGKPYSSSDWRSEYVGKVDYFYIMHQIQHLEKDMCFSLLLVHLENILGQPAVLLILMGTKL